VCHYSTIVADEGGVENIEGDVPGDMERSPARGVTPADVTSSVRSRSAKESTSSMVARLVYKKKCKLGTLPWMLLDLISWCRSEQGIRF
jgi:hypothetical protein